MKEGTIIRQIIKNVDSFICKDCAYFRERKGSLVSGKCIKFGEKNIVTGIINYSYANEVRGNDDLCGKRGVYYVAR